MTKNMERLSRIRENERLEYKSVATLDALAPSVVAMLNGTGGTIYAGYSDAGDFVGLPLDAAALAEALTHSLAHSISPKEFVQIVRQDDGGLAIEVPPGSQKPYVFRGRAFVRFGSTNRFASPSAMARLMNTREVADARWERRPAIGVDSEALDEQQISHVSEAFGERYGLPFIKPETVLAQLERLDLVEEGWPTLAAVILFRNEHERRFTQSSVRAASFDRSLSGILDEKSLSGGAFYLFDRSLTFLMANLPNASYLEPGAVQRTEKHAIPVSALREAIVNALMHRDYQDQAAIQIRLFQNRLEIWNPGMLPSEYLARDNKAISVSRPRNPDIARTFYLRRYAEMLGVGLHRIRTAMEQAGLPAPTWKNEAGGVLLTLPRSDNGRTVVLSSDALQFQPRLLDFLKTTRVGEKMTRREYQDKYAFGVSERSSRSDMQTLLKHGYIRQVGRGYHTSYVRTEKVWIGRHGD